MNQHDGYKYCVIHFLKLPLKTFDDFVCIPSSWVRLRRATDNKVIISYPVENSKDTEKRVKERQRLSEDWRIHKAVVNYSTDSYEDAQEFIKAQRGLIHYEYKCPNPAKNEGHELTEKNKAQQSKREDKTNHKEAVSQEFVLLKNDESATKLRLKRVVTLPKAATEDININSNVTTFGSIEPTESDSESEFSLSEASESSDENQLSSLYDDFSIKNYTCTQETTDIERSTNNTPSGIQNSSNLANQSLDPRIRAHNIFLTGFSKFLRDLQPSFGDINQIITSLIQNPEKTNQALKSFLDRWNLNSNVPTTSISKDTTAEATKISGTKRNSEKEQNDDDGNGEDQVVNKKRCHECRFVIPPEFDENDSRWTLKYRKSGPGLVELMPRTGVYVNAVKLSKCKRLAKDCKTLVRILMPEIFKTSALSTCSWTGARATAYLILGGDVRPGLDNNARAALISFVVQYGRKKGWRTDTKPILNNIRNKLRDMRCKQK